MKKTGFLALCMGIGLLFGAMPVISEEVEPELQGAWQIEAYELKDGETPRVRGTIIFSEHDWGVLFFVVDSDGRPLRASGEGGTYIREGHRLLLTHLYLMASGGDPVDGLKQAPPRMKIDSRHKEDCRIELTEKKLTIFFPSGNRLRFERSSMSGRST